jgi:PAS domain S-box-containing protein
VDTKIFEARPGISAVLLPDSPNFTIVTLSDDFIETTGRKRKETVGKAFFEIFKVRPDDPFHAGHDQLKDSLHYIIENKKPHLLPRLRYDLEEPDGNQVEKYWMVKNVPVLDDSGELIYIIHTAEDITSIVHSDKREEGLKGIEKAYNIFMNAPVIIGILRGANYVIELANEGLLEVWGRTNEVIGKPLLAAIPELEAQGFIPLLDQVCETGEPFHAYEFPITLKRFGKEEVLYFDFVYKPIYDDGIKDKASAIISVGHDVTMRVLAREKIQESESKYRHLFESMDQGFCILEMIYNPDEEPIDYRFLEANPVFEKQTGLKDAIGKRVLELVPDLEAHWLQLYGKVSETGESIRFIERSVAMGRWFEVNAFRIVDQTSPKVALLFTDITERKKNEEALKQSEHNLRNTILQAPVAMSILKGQDYVVEIANEKMYELWGRTREELLGKSIFEGLPEVRDQGYEELLNSVYTTGKPFKANGMPVTLPRNGTTETVYVNFLYTAFREGDGSISGIMAVATDVTEQVEARKKIEELVSERTKELAEANDALLISNKELQRSNANLEEFAYAASHDLKEPMRKIQLFSDRLKERLSDKLEMEDKNYLERILFATQRMNKLIDDLLMYSHVSRGAPIEEMVDLNQKVKIVLEDLEIEVEEKNARIIIEHLPTIKGNRRQLQQLFQNLIGNAIKYAKEDQPPEVHIRSRLVDSREESLPAGIEKGNHKYHLIEVNDKGIGFDQEDADRIFNVFTRLHGNAEYRGTGVGLSIARKVVENHGGYIWADSRPGEGSTFKVLLPAD